MINDATIDKAVSQPRWRRVLINLLLLVGIGAIVGLGIYLYILYTTQVYASAPVSVSVQSPAAAIERAVPAPRSDYSGRIAFKCDLSAADGLCVMDAQGGDVAPLSDPSVYEECRAGEPFSPDGNRVAFSRQVGEHCDIFSRDVRGGSVDQVVVNSGADYQPAWSPDGNLLAYVSQEETGSSIWVYDLMQGADRRLTHTPGRQEKHPSWSPDGSQIVFWSDRQGGMQLYVVDAEGGESHRLGPEGVNAWDPVWIKPLGSESVKVAAANSPEALGMGLAFYGERCQVEISAADSSGEAPLARVVLRANDEVLHDSGVIQTLLYHAIVDLGEEFGLKQLLLQAWNTEAFVQTPKELRREVVCVAPSPTPTPEPTSGPTPTLTLTPMIVTPVPIPDDVFAAATLAAKATICATGTGTPTPMPPNVITTTPTPVPIVVTSTPTPGNTATAVYRALLATAVAATTGTPVPTSPYVVTATATPIPTSTPRPTNTPVPTSTPWPTKTPVYVHWQTPTPASGEPTATPLPPIPHVLRGKILFKSDRGGPEAVFVMNPDGTDIGKLTADWPYELAAEGEIFGGDGRYVAFVREDYSGPQIFFHDFQFNVDRQVTRMGVGASWEPAFDQSGWRIAFVSSEPDNDEIFVINRDGTGLKRLTHNRWEWDRHPSWSPDETEIVFWSNRSGPRQIYVMSADGRNLRCVSDYTADDWDPVWVK